MAPEAISPTRPKSALLGALLLVLAGTAREAYALHILGDAAGDMAPDARGVAPEPGPLLSAAQRRELRRRA